MTHRHASPPRASRRSLLMEMASRLPTIGLIVGAVVVPAGCSSPRRGEARRFLEAIAKSNRRLGVASRQFSDTIAARLEGKASKEDVEAGLEKLQEVFGPLRQGMDEWLIPKNPEAEALIKTYRTHLDKREKNLEEFAPQIAEALTSGMVIPSERPKRVREIVEAMNKNEADLIASFKQAQRDYAATVGIFSYE